MNPFDVIFQSISAMTGGLIHDMTTVIVAVVALMFIDLGFSIIIDLLKDANFRNRLYTRLTVAKPSMGDVPTRRHVPLMDWTELEMEDRDDD